MTTCPRCCLSKPETDFYIRVDTGKRRTWCKTCENEARDLRRKANLEADLAKTLANTAVRDGILIEPGQCTSCSEVRPLQKHHEDYSKPYDVQWLCQQCHSRLHADKRRSKHELVS